VKPKTGLNSATTKYSSDLIESTLCLGVELMIHVDAKDITIVAVTDDTCLNSYVVRVIINSL
jgi:hypothetical protein